MSRLVLVAASALVLIALVAAGGAGAASPQVHAARDCHVNYQSTKGGYYITSIHVRHTSCATGKAVVRAYTKCRRAHGWRGKCGHRVKGFSCRRHIQESTPVQYDASVTCRRGAKRVTHTYTQNR